MLLVAVAGSASAEQPARTGAKLTWVRGAGAERCVGNFGEPDTELLEGAPPAISLEEFRECMSLAPAREIKPGEYWVRHPEGDPWFVAAWKPPGHILLSTSYTHHRFLRNLADMFDQGLAIATNFGARLSEEGAVERSRHGISTSYWSRRAATCPSK
jgi:hypothetical protein